MNVLIRLSRLPRIIIETILSTLSFIIGIGGTSFLLKALGQSPMRRKQEGSTWEAPSGSTNDQRMY